LFWVSERLDQECRTLLVEPKGKMYQKSAADIRKKKESATAIQNFKSHFVNDVWSSNHFTARSTYVLSLFTASRINLMN